MTTTLDSMEGPVPENTQPQLSVEALAGEFEKTDIEERSDAQAEDTQPPNDAEPSPARPLIVYTRKQMLILSQSPLVKPPADMPEFKSWFGELNEQALHAAKKESETTNGNGSARERRYRRDPEDGEGLSRPPFRSALSQPSQMGNFKHQPLRSSDRDRDTERDLRTLSDKFDRERGRGERIGLPAHSSLLRNRDRDSAPHLLSDREPQRLVNRKRNGESKEDWRRGAEPPRPGRDDPHSRREREDREPRAREGSRHRDSPPSTRRDRDEHRRERDRDRFIDADDDTRRWRDDGKRDERLAVRRDKERSDRDKDRGRDRSRDPADNDRDSRDGWTVAEEKGGRRGGRDRRQDDARERDDRKEREKEKEPAWMETYVPPPSSSGGILGGKGTEGEIDSIQAWKMDMKRQEMKALGVEFEPDAPPPVRASASSASTSKSGGKKAEGDMDTQGKAGGRSTEEKAKPDEAEAQGLSPVEDRLKSASSTSNLAAGDLQLAKAPASVAGGQLDEIQLFKLMMKQEEKKRVMNGDSASEDRSSFPGVDLRPSDTVKSGLMRIREGRSPSITVAPGEGAPTSLTDIAPILTDPLAMSKSTSSLNAVPLSATKAPSPLSQPLLGSQSLASVTNSSLAGATESNGPRLLSAKTPESTFPLSDGHALSKDTSPQMAFDPPRQSRLLAFGAQSVKAPAQPTPQSASAAVQMNRLQQLDPSWSGQRRPSVSPVIPQQSNPQQSPMDHVGAFGGHYDLGAVENMQRRPTIGAVIQHGLPYDSRPLDSGELGGRDLARNSISLASASDRAVFLSQVDTLHQLSDVRRHPTPPNAHFNVTSPVSPFDSQIAGNQSTYSSGKGSRMAKHFERARDPSQATSVNRLSNATLGANGGVHGRQEHQIPNAALGPENRIQDLLTMLSNSAQSQRAHQLHGLNQSMSVQQSGQPLHIGPTGPLGRLDMNDPDEGRFAPDGLVPGLRPAPSASQRNRDISNGSMYSNQLDDALSFNGRLGPQQRTGIEQLYSGPVPSQFNGQGANVGRGGLGFQQQALRGGPSPINNFSPMQGQPQQRLPPGLANLGGRPPHEPSQFLGGGAGAGNFGVPNQLHAGLQPGNGHQSFNQFQGPGGLGGLIGNQNVIRGQPGLAQLGGPLNSLNGVDYRAGPGGPNQNQLLGLGGPNIGQAMRGGPGLNAQQQLHGPNQVPPNMSMRQQQSMQPQLMPQMISPQQLQHGLQGGQHNPADLMALLMGNGHRE